MTSVVIKPSTNKDKKMMAIFSQDGKKIKTTHFGAKGYQDFTSIVTGDEERRKLYLARHNKNENWNDYKSSGSLSRYILWGDSKSIQTNITSYKRRFNLK